MTKMKEQEQLNNGTGYEWEYAKKIDNRTTSEKILNFIYNPVTNAVLGRTAKSWGALLIFYVIFYSVLALLFAICMKVLLASLKDEYPKWQLSESIIGTSPGLGFRPMANDSEAASIIWYNLTTKEHWIQSLRSFEDKHYKKNMSYAQTCKYGSVNLQKDDYCRVSFDDFGKCAQIYSYGYGIGRPCVFLKLNRIYGWVPEYMNTTDSLPKNIPAHTVSKIEEEMKAGRINQVWLSCDGESPHDRDNMGPIEYFPSPGFPYYFYPYLNTKHYMSPLVAVQFTDPKRGVLINIECRAWAKNIIYKNSAQLREGSVHFELQIDEPK